MAEQTPMSPLRRFFYRLGVLAAVVLVLGLVAGAWLLGRFGADTAVAYKDDLEHFNLWLACQRAPFRRALLDLARLAGAARPRRFGIVGCGVGAGTGTADRFY